ncbi:MAG TPA: cyclopropane-fatty-acyl-phospholipid synthase family protein [Steroidobacter sp.]|jgi:cyclopropane-fatty-acyl-phospholipid synthase|nr:cyclopropane-fatty-acyl-phospholipid synthase family protein [Steroidobacteraceae bacterium]HLS80058.1 cyclopropane-fatty-acyl-phospholipid synthase family protein [Steroidobacter sp.]
MQASKHPEELPLAAESASGYAGEGVAVAQSASLEGRMLRLLLSAFGDPRVRIVLWNGESICTSPETPVATVRLANRATLLRLCADPDVQFGEGYSAGDIDVQGDLGLLIEEIYRGAAAPRGGGAVALARRIAHSLHRRPANTLQGSQHNIHHHYDIGNEFYSLWLGATMAYTCAYFPTESATLDEAQVAKMDHVCRKLRLRPGQKVVEAGCGWGSLALHMAERYGVEVRAFNISREQIAYARDRAKERGLDGRVEFVLDDYRNISGRYDAFASVGMLEHVGVENYEELGRIIYRSLAPHGLGLIHTIGRNRPKPMHRWIDKRIFPGASPPSLKQMMDIFEGGNLSVLDVENIRLHYAKTLACWIRLYERSAQRVAQMFDERFVRMWRLYLEGSGAAFRTGELQLFQVVFAHGGNNAIPWTRADVYAS